MQSKGALSELEVLDREADVKKWYIATAKAAFVKPGALSLLDNSWRLYIDWWLVWKQNCRHCQGVKLSGKSCSI